VETSVAMLPLRQDLHDHLLAHREDVLDSLVAMISATPSLDHLHDLARTPAYREMLRRYLELLIDNLADQNDRRCFEYARDYAAERFRENVPAVEMLRLAALLRHSMTLSVEAALGVDEARAQIVDEQIRQLESAFETVYQEGRDRQWRVSETKYFALLENASEAILSLRPEAGVIIEANVQAERLLGRSREDLLSSHFSTLFPPHHRDQIEWLVGRPAGTPNMRLDDLSVLRSDGLTVPVSISCTWIEVEGTAVVQTIVRDVTELRQMQRELRDYAGQLEARVAERTAELRGSEERLRSLFLQEQRRARHLSLINEVQKCALATSDIATFINQVTRAIQSHFHDCGVSFLLCEPIYNDLLTAGGSQMTMETNTLEDQPLCGTMIAVAHAGNAARTVAPGDRCEIAEETLRAWKAERSSLDQQAELHRQTGSGAAGEVQVPLIIGKDVAGVITVSGQADAVETRDAIALQTAAAIVAAHLQSSRLFRRMRHLNDFNQTLISEMLNSLLVVSQDGTIRFVNNRACQVLRQSREQLIMQPLSRVLAPGPSEMVHLAELLRAVTEDGVAQELKELRVWTPERPLVFEVRAFRVWFRGQAQAVFLLFDVTERWRKTNQMQLMNEMGHSFQASLDVDKVLHAVLTCITAGSALGFNRAFLLLREEGRDTLKGAMALGPASWEEAQRIWYELSQQGDDLHAILESPEIDAVVSNPLQERLRDLTIDLANPAFAALAVAVRERRAVCVQRDQLLRLQNGAEQPAADELAAAEMFSAPEMAIAPLLAKDHVVGVVLADNLYSGAPIEPDALQLLETLAQQAGLTVDNALTYRALQKAQRELMSAERLVAVGEMAARVSHEIRNPLTTIGGFARGVLRHASDPAVVREKAEIIVNEVERLETLLTDLLDMAVGRPLEVQRQNVNDIVEHSLLLADADIQANRVCVERHLATDLPELEVDRGRLLQALLNTLRNGAQAMETGGALVVTTRVAGSTAQPMLEIEVKDSGSGIPERALKQVFDPFFSTKIRGSGLGLAITRRIVQDHGGMIDVYSNEGEGTTFILCFPLPAEVAPAPA